MEAEKTRKKPPGRKRLYITLSVVVAFLLGIPVWWKSTEVYRAPLPFSAIEAHANEVDVSALALPCHLHIILAVGPTYNSGSLSNESLQKVADKFLLRTHELIRESQSASPEGCAAEYQVLVTLDAMDSCISVGNRDEGQYWPCGLAKSSLSEVLQLSDDNLLDEFFWSFSKGTDSATGGRYTLVVLDGFPNEQFSKQDGELTKISTESRPGNGEEYERRIVVGKYRHAWMTGFDSTVSSFEEEVASSIAEVAVTYFRNGGQSSKTGLDNRVESMPFSADGEAILSFSLLNADLSDWIFDWSFEDVEERFLQPVVDAVEPIARLFVESQVLYYTPKAVPSHWDETLQAHVVPFKQLPFFVNANEWHLDSSSAAAGRSKLLHFAIYVPAANECPLLLQLTSGRISPTNGFTSPGWGGIIVWNPPSCGESTPDNTKVHRLSTKDLEPLIGVVVAQLRTLFGLPPTFVEDSTSKIYGVPANATGFADWEVDALLRRRAAMDVHASASTLASLSRLVSSLPNMVIKDEIGDQVRSSLAAAKAARNHSLAGAYHATAEAARNARAWAEAAFFQPSIMSLLYFPAEHQLAIYTPFFVPVLLHILVAVVKDGSRYRREWRIFLRAKVQKQD